MSARGVPVLIPALAASGVAVSTYKVYGWVPDSAGSPTATPRTFYTDPELTTPASNPATLGASTRLVYVSPSTSIVLQIKSSDGATTYGEPYFPGNNSDVGTIDDYTGSTDTARLLAWVASGDRYLQLTRDVTLTAEIAIPDFCWLDLGGYTVFKGYNGNMFTMGQYARILNGRIDGAGATYTGNGITISGGSAKMHQGLVNVDMINTEGYNVEVSGDFSGLGFYWSGGSFYRYDPTLDAIKLPDTESGTSGLRYFAFLSGNGSAMMDVSGGRVTTIKACNAASLTLRDTSAYLLMDESRIVQLIDRIAVTGATKANPCVITAASHGLRNGDSVTFYSIGGMTELNGNNYTVANVTTNTFELSGTNSSAYTTYTSGGYAKNRSAHCVRGSYHQIQGIQGTTLDGSTVMRLMPAANNVILDVHPGQSLQDDSAVTSNRTLTWPDKVKFGTGAPYITIDPGADNVIHYKGVYGANNRFTIGTDSGANTEIIAYNGNLQLGGGGAVTGLDMSASAITSLLALSLTGDTTPVNDNTQKMGTASKRFSELFAGNGTINTSDAATKTPLEPIPEGVKRAMRTIMGGIGVFRFLDSVARKGDGARLQIGVTAQSVRDAFAAEGEDASRWSLFCSDPIFETIEIEEETSEFLPVAPQKREITDTVTVNEEGRVVVRKVKRTEDYFPEYEMVPVINEDGSPVLNQEGQPSYASRPKHEWRTVRKTRTEQRRKLNEDGSEAVLLGLRPDQLFWLALACLEGGAVDQPETPPLGYADEAPEPEPEPVVEVAPEPEPEPAPYVPDFTLIPEKLARFAEADEDVDAFRKRLKGYWQRFGIADGENFPGGGEPLSGDEKIQMREIDILLNSDEGKAARLHDWLFAD